jgi:hypothetical protein
VDERELVVPRAQEAFTSQGHLHDPDLAAGLRAIVKSLIERIGQKAA